MLPTLGKLIDIFMNLAYHNISQIKAGKVHKAQNKIPRSCRSGGFLARYGELFRLGCCCLFISVQPFAYVVANHTRNDRDNKSWNNIVHKTLTSFLLEARQLLKNTTHFHNSPQFPQKTYRSKNSCTVQYRLFLLRHRIGTKNVYRCSGTFRQKSRLFFGNFVY